jgi:Zinc finger, C2H2 type
MEDSEKSTIEPLYTDSILFELGQQSESFAFPELYPILLVNDQSEIKRAEIEEIEINVTNISHEQIKEETCETRKYHLRDTNCKTDEYYCHQCELIKCFNTRRELINHIDRNHVRNFSHICHKPKCTHKYTTKSSLQLHSQRIHGEKRFVCKICGQRYAVNGDLSQHIKRKHNPKYTPKRTIKRAETH